MNKRFAAVAIAALATVGLAACAASETDFREAAEKALSGAGEEQGVEVTDVSCEDPESTEIGTQFWCSATVDGVTADIPAEITGEKTVTVKTAEATPAE